MARQARVPGHWGTQSDYHITITAWKLNEIKIRKSHTCELGLSVRFPISSIAMICLKQVQFFHTERESKRHWKAFCRVFTTHCCPSERRVPQSTSIPRFVDSITWERTTKIPDLVATWLPCSTTWHGNVAFKFRLCKIFCQKLWPRCHATQLVSLDTSTTYSERQNFTVHEVPWLKCLDLRISTSQPSQPVLSFAFCFKASSCHICLRGGLPSREPSASFALQELPPSKWMRNH